MLSKLLGIKEFKFPYTDFDFPGKHSQEKVLFVTRESEKILLIRLLLVLLATTVTFFFFVFSLKAAQTFLQPPAETIRIIFLSTTLFLSFLCLLACWWFITLWEKSVFIITTRRLTKIIYTSPWNKYHLSLNLDKIVDGGAYKKGLLQPLLGLGYFVARSSAGNIKNFKIVNIDFAEDLHNYLTKLLYTFNTKQEELDNFRPFIPYLKGEERRRFAPEYYSRD